jgi:hypothetical protein
MFEMRRAEPPSFQDPLTKSQKKLEKLRRHYGDKQPFTKTIDDDRLEQVLAENDKLKTAKAKLSEYSSLSKSQTGSIFDSRTLQRDSHQPLIIQSNQSQDPRPFKYPQAPTDFQNTVTHFSHAPQNSSATQKDLEPTNPKKYKQDTLET